MSLSVVEHHASLNICSLRVGFISYIHPLHATVPVVLAFFVMYKYRDLFSVLLCLILIVFVTISIFAYKTKEYGSTVPINRTENSQPSAVLDIIELKEQFPAPSANSGSTGSNITQRELAKAEETWKRSIERRFAERRESVRARCEEVGPYSYNAKRTAQMSFYCSKNYNIFVCVTAKVSGTR